MREENKMAKKIQNIDCYKENLICEIYNNNFYVNGNYYIPNNKNKPIELIMVYIFPSELELKELDYLLIYDVTNLKDIEYKKNENLNEIQFKVNINSNTEGIFQISYRQKIKNKRIKWVSNAIHSLTTKFEEAEYKLILPKNLKIKEMNIQPKDKINMGDKAVYFWNKKESDPQRILNLSFEEYSSLN